MTTHTKLPWLALLPTILAALAPKCPLCLAAYLSAFGVTLGMASFTLTVLRPLALASAGLALAVLIFRARRAAVTTKLPSACHR